MTTTVRSQPAAVTRPDRRLVHGVSVALGVAAVALSIGAIATDDVATIVESRTITEPRVSNVPVADQSPTDRPGACGYPSLGVIVRC